ncbi:MAG: hypothetical protein IKH38_04605 [Clostridia bacterium]|nr:hypothetical protein [Clostridia bacterium]
MKFYLDLLRKSWAALTRNPGLAFGAALLARLPSLILYVLNRTGVLVRDSSLSNTLISMLVLLVGDLLGPGLVIICLKLLRGESARLTDLLRGLRFAGRYLLAILLMELMFIALLAVVILLALIGLIGTSAAADVFAVVLMIAFYLLLESLYGLFGQAVVDRDTSGPVDALRRSRAILRGHRRRFVPLAVLTLLSLTPLYLLAREQSPEAYLIATVLGAVVFILSLALYSAFYEAVRPADPKGPSRGQLRKARRTAGSTGV